MQSSTTTAITYRFAPNSTGAEPVDALFCTALSVPVPASGATTTNPCVPFGGLLGAVSDLIPAAERETEAAQRFLGKLGTVTGQIAAGVGAEAAPLWHSRQTFS